MAKTVASSYKFVISRDGGKRPWIIDLKKTPPFVGQVPSDDKSKVDVEFSISDEDFIKLASGKLKPDQVASFFTIIKDENIITYVVKFPWIF
jgi:hypothetical protein